MYPLKTWWEFRGDVYSVVADPISSFKYIPHSLATHIAKAGLIALVLAALLLGISFNPAHAQSETIKRGVLNFSIPFARSGFLTSQTRVGLGYEVDNLNTSGRLDGGGGAVYMLPFGHFQLGVEVYGISGNRFSQGKIGLSYGAGGFEVRAGARAYHVEAGAGYALGSGFIGYVGATTFGKQNAYAPNTSSSPSPSVTPSLPPLPPAQ